MCCCKSTSKEKSSGGPDATTPPDCTEGKCDPPCKLVKLTVILNATQTNVTGAKNWATVKKATDDVIVKATTTPDTEACWKKINWSGDSGTEVPGKPNQRKLSRATSKKYHVQAELGGESDDVDVWVLWATVTILTSGTTPANSAQFGTIGDGTEKLGAIAYDGGKQARGKVAPFAIITPKGVHNVIESGWEFKRDMKGHVWVDGVKLTSDRRFWKPGWVDDTSAAVFKKLTPDTDDKIYDLDGPNIKAVGTNDAEVYYNFRQWIEWNGEVCSDRTEWRWQGRWQKSASPQVTLKNVGTGNIKLPDKSHFHP